MANPFDQFDAPPATASPPSSGNAFDQFDTAPPPASAGAPPPPTDSSTLRPAPSEGLGFYQGITKPVDAAAGALHDAMGHIAVSDLLMPGLADTISRATGGKYPTQTIQSTIDGLGSMLGMPSVQDAIKAHKDYIAAQPEQPGTTGRVAGEVAGTLPLMFENPVVGGALTGGLLSDQKDPQGVLEDMALGAAGGKGGELAMRGAAGVVAPKLSSAVRSLLDEGVQLTPGQTAGGMFKRAEDAATSLPFVGDMIKGAQRRSITSFNTAAANRALAPIGESVPSNIAPGHDTIAYIGDRLGQKYDNIMPSLAVTADPTYTTGMTAVKNAAANLPPPHSTQFDNLFRDYLDKFQTGQMSGQDFKNAQSILGQKIARYGSSPIPADRDLADTFSAARDELNDLLERSNPANAAELQSINRGYANLTRLQTAASRASPTAGAQDAGGVFTPTALKSAVRQGDRTIRKRGTAEGTALLQDLAENGQSVLPSSVPDSGTVGRGLTNAALLGGGAHLLGLADPTTLATMGGLAAAYSKPGTALLRGAIANRPTVVRGIADAMRRNTGVAGLAGAAGLEQAAQPGQ